MGVPPSTSVFLNQVSRFLRDFYSLDLFLHASEGGQPPRRGDKPALFQLVPVVGPAAPDGFLGSLKTESRKGDVWLWLSPSFPACIPSTLGVSFWGAVLSLSGGDIGRPSPSGAGQGQ